MILGITGGMGCGKSKAVEGFVRHGFRPLDSDRQIRDEILPSPEVTAALQSKFGPSVFGTDGRVDRARLAAKVFADESLLRWLEELTHPRLFALWRSALSADPGASWVAEVPLLFEKRLENWFDFTVCVASSPEQQLARLEQRGLNRALAEQRISKQLPLARKIELADMVLWNDGSPEFLQAQIDHLAESLMATC